MFNPRFFYREWHSCNNNYTVFLISIHTPTQGVTRPEDKEYQDIKHFNPHSHAGSDVISASPNLVPFYFNPHSHAGSDNFSKILNQNCIIISIHTPTQGVTLAPVFSLPYSFDFNPHSHAGSDLNRMCLPICSLNFNPHSHAGSDQKPQVLQLNGKHFNPHSHAGSDACMKR